MKLNIIVKPTIFISVLLFALYVVAVPAFASNDDHHDQTTVTASSHSNNHDDQTATHESQIEQMMNLIDLLTQAVVLLEKQIDVVHDSKEADHHGAEAMHSDDLAVWIELHSSMTHAHVKESGKEEVSFMIEGISYTEESAVIAAVVLKTGISEHDVMEVIVFPSGEVDEHGDTAHHEDGHNGHDGDDGLSGIHIMSDGMIMLGNGDPVMDASITDEGMIKLADGTIVEPKFDLR
jgi:hypothetical protein